MSLVMLHELGHVLGVFGADTGDNKTNGDNTRKVLDNCFGYTPVTKNGNED